MIRWIKRKIRLFLFLIVVVVLGVIAIDFVQSNNRSENSKMFDAPSSVDEIIKEIDVSGLSYEEIMETLKKLKERK